MTTAAMPLSATSLEVTRIIAAPRERVFAALTRPEQIQQWFGPPSMKVTHVKADARPAGGYHIEMKGKRPSQAADPNAPTVQEECHGTYKEVQPNSLISFTWRGTWSPDEETVVTIRLSDVEGGTKLVLQQEGFLSRESCEAHRQGWEMGIGNVANLTEKS